MSCSTMVRNAVIFQGKYGSTEMIVRQAETLVIHTSNAAAAELKEDSSRTIAIKWKAPCRGWVKINSDGATAESGNWSATGGILHDSHGNWLAGFCRFIGRGSALTIAYPSWSNSFAEGIHQGDNCI
ncbi:hypothetical protein PVK06_003363 [Gossypium arboreum]|uniref:RNase H type-1 domain-containing protein n=1 Tax=Gossypium arboreum TaxID=29729 RepID=A0ABR0R627_GOSAR|nr:hypothetical protein PVK06_003363 [Gossypium arboreum]